MLKLCDKLRDVDLVELGVVLEDQENNNALIKLMPADEIKKQQQEKERKAAEAKKLKEEKASAAKAERLAKLKLGETKPEDYFKVGEYQGLFSKYDETGFPTHNQEGIEVAKSAKKKYQKRLEQHVKLHQQYLEAKQTGEI
jgi:cysteinyl-tRNA synthetase